MNLAFHLSLQLGYTALLYASKNGELAIVQALLAAGAEKEIKLFVSVAWGEQDGCMGQQEFVASK